MRALAFDIDGTLTNDNGDIPELTKNFLKEYSKTSFVYLATGKPLQEVKTYLKKLQLKKGYVVCNGGALIYSIHEKKVIATDFIEDQEKRHISHLAATNSFGIIAYGEKGLYTYAFSERLKEFIKRNFSINPVFFEDYYDFVDTICKTHIFNIWLLVNHSDLTHDKNIVNITKSINLSEKLFAIITKNKNIIVFNKKANKYDKLLFAVQKEGFQAKDVIYFGDGLIDLECIKRFGYGIAMDNAVQEVKNVAKEVCNSNNEEGVYQWLMLNKKHWSKPDTNT